MPHCFYLIWIYVFQIQNFPIRGILRVVDIYWLYAFSHEQVDLVWGGSVLVYLFYNNVSPVFNYKFISFCNQYFIDSSQLSANNDYNRSKYHAAKTNNFEEVLSFNKASWCVVYLFVHSFLFVFFSCSHQLLGKLFVT